MYYVPIVLGFVSLVIVLSGNQPVARILGLLVGLAAATSAGLIWFRPSADVLDNVLFLALSAGAVGVAGGMVGSRNPVYAALWFALVTLSVCGMFVIQSAPFLAAATTIIYAGAIIVTFLFVIMLARQAGTAAYDQHSNQPLLATSVAFVLLGALLVYLGNAQSAIGAADKGQPASQVLAVPQAQAANSLSQPVDTAAFGNIRGFGRSLFGDYLYAVELAGTLLLVAAIAAIVISPKRAGAMK